VRRIDHVVYAVRDLDAAARRYRDEYGLSSIPGGRHPRWGTANRIVPLGATYLELLAVEDPSVAPDIARPLLEATEESDRWYSICVADDDLEATAARLGLEVRPGARTRPDGAEVRWRGAGFDDPNRPPWLPFFITWDVPDELLPGRAPAPPHPSGAVGIEAVEVGGDPAVLRAWLGDVALPIAVVGDEPGVRAVRLATDRGGVVQVG
jgi:catechol 2,3-dioxygenase-like lactoylglutathione lyase family enzyme